MVRCRSRGTLPVDIGPSAREQLMAQSTDGVVPLPAVLEMRRVLSRPSEIEHATLGTQIHKLFCRPRSPIHFEAWLSEWALDAGVLDALIRNYRVELPEVVVEFGSGTSTIVLGAARGGGGPRTA